MVRRVKRVDVRAWSLHVALPLALGAASYIVLRSWAPVIGAHAPLWPHAPRMLRDHFADAAWGWALGAFVSLMWRGEKRAHRAVWIVLAACVAAGFELLQSTHITLGAFDGADLVAQTGAVLLAASILGEREKRWTSENAAH